MGKCRSAHAKFWREYKAKRDILQAVKFVSVDDFKRYFVLNHVQDKGRFEYGLFTVDITPFKQQFLGEFFEYKFVSRIEVTYEYIDSEDGGLWSQSFDVTGSYGKFMIKCPTIANGTEFKF